ncbi:hypothetical protein COO60DRAFT_1625993 [Scenedesmus sp. NREL 46B-D3]|nr:hypothetical protein COO60DRAFT_1625993 [Scenedesmus sp. NREL 46B-D3]
MHSHHHHVTCELHESLSSANKMASNGVTTSFSSYAMLPTLYYRKAHAACLGTMHDKTRRHQVLWQQLGCQLAPPLHAESSALQALPQPRRADEVQPEVWRAACSGVRAAHPNSHGHLTDKATHASHPRTDALRTPRLLLFLCPNVMQICTPCASAADSTTPPAQRGRGPRGDAVKPSTALHCTALHATPSWHSSADTPMPAASASQAAQPLLAFPGVTCMRQGSTRMHRIDLSRSRSC